MPPAPPSALLLLLGTHYSAPLRHWLPPVRSLGWEQAVAAHTMTREGWGYYSSGADDEITLRENHLAFGRIQLRPRILVNVKEIDLRTTILGQPASLPLYFTATAMGRLANEEGEIAIVRAAHGAGVQYMLPTLSSCTADEMLEARAPGQVRSAHLSQPS